MHSTEIWKGRKKSLNLFAIIQILKLGRNLKLGCRGFQNHKMFQFSRHFISFQFFTCPFPASFFSSFVFSTAIIKFVRFKQILVMTGFEPRTSGIGTEPMPSFHFSLGFEFSILTATKVKVWSCYYQKFIKVLL